MSKSAGSAHLPMHHLSVRVPWHDTGWTGMVCGAPGQNHFCTALRNIKENKVPELEEDLAGRAWTDLSEDELPPCVLERGGFMRSATFNKLRTHRYSFSKTGPHARFDKTVQRMPAYSVEATPFRWVMRDQASTYAERWDIEVDQALEDRADGLMSFDSHWIQDARNQLALLDSFFSAIEPNRSLVFLYAKDLPLVEQPLPGERFLVGVGFATNVEAVQEWEYSEDGPLRSVLWERGVGHSIRPDFRDGFLLPYHELLARPDLAAEGLDRFVARAPMEHFDEFSYVTELVTQDGAINALTELSRVLALLPGVVDGPWEAAAEWTAARLAEAWAARGPYPGLAAMLAAAGIGRGPVIARRVLDELPDDAVDIWPQLEKAMEQWPADIVGRTSRKLWARLVGDAERYRMFRAMSRFALSVDQAKRAFAALDPAEMVDNPYLLFESDRRQQDAVSFSTIDHGVWPQDAAARDALAADPLPDPITEAADDRRVRAACVSVLEAAATEGHTVVDEPGLRRRLSALDLTPPCDPVDAAFDLAAEGFSPVLVERPLATEGRGWQLDRLAVTTQLIRDEVDRRLHAPALPLTWPWRERIDAAIDQGLPADPRLREIEDRARDEKAAALELLACARVAALIGPAGTGKTTMLEALCSDPHVEAGGVLLLAPTGKARVQLASRVKAKARTVAQFLAPDRFGDLGYHVNPAGPVEHGFKTIIVDEASMLTEEMLAAVIDATAGVDRLILCGDPRQLPPIGAGRPFADLVAHLRDAGGTGGGVAELTVGRRQLPTAEDVEHVRDDVAIASLFSIDAPLISADDALARAVAGETDGTFRLETWVDEDDLHRKIVEVLCEDPDLGLSAKDSDALVASFGARREGAGRPRLEWGAAGEGAERWQILSPVRARPGGVAGLNALVRKTWRSGDVSLAHRTRSFAPPMGADQIVFNDKIMWLENRNRRTGEDVKTRAHTDGSIANGEIGMVVWKAGNKGWKPDGLKLEFSTQKGVQYTVWKNELNGDEGGELIELAYAVTIHKSQGSQFLTTFVVVPDPCPLLSPELLYTALTRQQDRVVLLKQGEAGDLRQYASPSRSETARRLTCLFRPANPFALADGTIVDGSHVHRTAAGELVRSKSEVIVANTLHALGASYAYEEELRMADGTRKLPDFTIHRPSSPPVYWEHLGMLDRPGYAADWKAKKAWYAAHDIKPWKEGGGSYGTLVWSTENHESAGIDAQAISALAREVLA